MGLLGLLRGVRLTVIRPGVRLYGHPSYAALRASDDAALRASDDAALRASDDAALRASDDAALRASADAAQLIDSSSLIGLPSYWTTY
jgi:hypothetical protein